jgi:hypothetical protein
VLRGGGGGNKYRFQRPLPPCELEYCASFSILRICRPVTGHFLNTHRVFLSSVINYGAGVTKSGANVKSLHKGWVCFCGELPVACEAGSLYFPAGKRKLSYGFSSTSDTQSGNFGNQEK